MLRILKWLPPILGGMALLGLLILGLGYRNAVAQPVIVQQTISLAGLEQPLRVVLISDIHYGWPDMRTGRLNAIVRTINAQHPDLVVLAGDYMGGKWLDWPRSWLEEALPPLAALSARYGAYAILGNHDSPHWVKTVLARQIAPKLLERDVVDIGPLVLAGFPSVQYTVPSGADQNALINRLPRNKPALLLMHEPEQLLATSIKPRPGILALAGHTHGGQIVLPLVGAIAEYVHGVFPCRLGVCTINGWPVYVTSGLGTSTLPMRFGVPPEIVVLNLVPGGPLNTGHQASGRKSGTER